MSSWFGIDPGLNVLYWKTMALALLGQYEGVAKSSEQVRSELLNHGNAHTVAAGNFYTIVWPQFLFGNLDACESDAVALVTYCGERKVEHLKRNGVLCHACVRARREPTDENIATIRQALDSNRTRDAHLFESVFVAQLAECLLKAGNTVAAEAAVREGFAFVGRSGEQFWLAELHRLDGLVALKQPQPDLSRVEPASSPQWRLRGSRTPECWNFEPRQISRVSHTRPALGSIPARCWSNSWFPLQMQSSLGTYATLAISWPRRFPVTYW
ncbi:hypothetical protein NKL07_30970 [Mesorhizobium sp. C280B]|uniref:hypothetical protein n=1 Tax=unclassified Mesorhizobium TaxID=325217 RepID=UPI0012EBDB9E|nr:hypothetical protein [Mesorhizobium sp. LSJC280B00]